MTVGPHIPRGSSWVQGNAPESIDAVNHPQDIGLTITGGWATIRAAGGNSPAPVADFLNIFSPTQGAIIAIENHRHGCRYTWSDVAFSVWAQQCGRAAVDPKTLEWIVRHQIETDETVDVIHAVGGEGTYYPPTGSWDSYKNINGNNPGGKFLQLLGTVHGLGVGWFLQEHKDILGEKKIKYIRLVQDEDIGIYSMVLALTS